MKEIDLHVEKLGKTEEILASYLITDLKELLGYADEPKIEDGKRDNLWSILQHFGPMMGIGELTSIEQITELHDAVEGWYNRFCRYDADLGEILHDIDEQEKMLLLIGKAITLMKEK